MLRIERASDRTRHEATHDVVRSGTLSCSCLRSATSSTRTWVLSATPAAVVCERNTDAKRRIAIYQRQRHDFGEFVERLVAHRSELGRQFALATRLPGVVSENNLTAA
jgi:hypothetical protein